MKRSPKFEVPRLVWQIVYVLFVSAAVVPLFILFGQIPYRWDQTLIEQAAPVVVAMVYGSAVFSAAGKSMTWLFGPLPLTPRTEARLAKGLEPPELREPTQPWSFRTQKKNRDKS